MESLRYGDYVKVVAGFFSGQEGFVEESTFVGWELFGKKFGWESYKIRKDNMSFVCERKELVLQKRNY